MGWGAVVFMGGSKAPHILPPQDLCSQHLQTPQQPSLGAP